MSDKTEFKNAQHKTSKTALRRGLMGAGLLIVLLGAGGFYLTGGRYISTENAYIKADKILITPEVTGTIEKVMVTDNQQVHDGDILMVIDRRTYQIAFEKAKADLAVVASHIDELKAAYLQKIEMIARAKLEADYAKNEFDRRAAMKSVVPETERDEFKRRRDTALKDLEILQQELGQITAQLGGDPAIKTEDHPAYKSALATLQQASLHLEQTEVKAPTDGIISAAPRQGDFARASAPQMTMIGNKDIWIEANFKETQLTDVRPGQPVTFRVDTYPDIEWHGRIESISPGTGSEFSILPAQNATGNWVKIVQRIAVRIAIEPAPDHPPLRAGMSTHAVIDTGTYPHLSRKKRNAG